jgi:hypothetical protein
VGQCTEDAVLQGPVSSLAASSFSCAASEVRTEKASIPCSRVNIMLLDLYCTKG